MTAMKSEDRQVHAHKIGLKRVAHIRGASQSFLRWLFTAPLRRSRCVNWPFSFGSHGYPQTWDGATVLLAHRLVLEEVTGERPEGLEAAHSCGNQACVHPSHLRWATPEENAADKAEHGTEATGEAKHRKLTPFLVRQIRARASAGERAVDMEDDYPLTRGALQRVINRRTYKDVA